MKNKFKKFFRISILPLVALGICAVLYSFKVKPAQYAYAESYKMSVNTFTAPADGSAPENLSELDKLRCISSQKAVQYDLKIYSAGSFEMTHQELGSPNVKSMGSNQTMFIKSDQDNVTAYDAYGNQVDQYAQNPEAISDMNEVLAEAVESSNGFDLNAYLGEASKAGAQVIEQGANYVRFQAQTPSGATSEFEINSQTGVCTYSKLSQNGETVVLTGYEYDNSPRPKLLEEIKISFETAESGVKFKKVTITKFSNHTEEISGK